MTEQNFKIRHMSKKQQTYFPGKLRMVVQEQDQEIMAALSSTQQQHSTLSNSDPISERKWTSRDQSQHLSDSSPSVSSLLEW